MATAPTISPTDWAQKFATASDADPEIRAHGKYFSCSYLLDMVDHTFVIQMSEGRVIDVAVDPGPLDVPYQFAIRAGIETWQNFGVPTPPPMYHGIWAATFQRDMKLEGDVLVLMQNLRCITRQMILLRSTGVPA